MLCFVLTLGEMNLSTWYLEDLKIYIYIYISKQLKKKKKKGNKYMDKIKKNQVYINNGRSRLLRSWES